MAVLGPVTVIVPTVELPFAIPLSTVQVTLLLLVLVTVAVNGSTIVLVMAATTGLNAIPTPATPVPLSVTDSLVT